MTQQLRQERPRHPARRQQSGPVAWQMLTSLVVVCATAACTAGTSGAGPASTPASASVPSNSQSAVKASTPAPSLSVGVYAHTGAGMLADAVRSTKPQVYVPNTKANTVDVIDPATMTVVRSFPVGREPQHVVPSWDLRTLWVNDDRSNDLYPIDAATGHVGPKVAVDDPYNLYFTPDGTLALVMAERLHRIDYRDPHTMALQHSLQVPCAGVNHADFSADGSFFIASCEFSGTLLVVPTDGSAVRSVIDLNAVQTPDQPDPAAAAGDGPRSQMQLGVNSMPQDVRLSPDGSTFLVADMQRGGVWLIDAATQRERGFVSTGKGAHGVYPSRDASVFYVSNRDEGTVSVLDSTSLTVRSRWVIPGGGSPDMGGVSADGSQLWLSGRYDDVVYVLSTVDGRLLAKVRVGSGPHGLAVWPQPGRHSLGHTGNMR